MILIPSLRRLVIAAVLFGALGIAGSSWWKLREARADAARERHALAVAQGEALAREGAAKAETRRTLASSDLDNAILRARAERLEKAGVRIVHKVVYEGIAEKPVEIAGGKPVADQDGTLRCPPFRFRLGGGTEQVGMMDADGTLAAVAQGWGAVYDLDGTLIERREFEQKKLTYEVVRLPAEKPEPRTLIGPSAGVLVGEAVGWSLGGQLCPAAWASDHRWAEGRLCVGADYLSGGLAPGGGTAILVTARPLFGVGRR